MNIFQSLFGGGNTSSVSTPTNMNPITGAVSGNFGNYLNGLIGAGGAPSYQGALTAGTTSNQNTLMADIMPMVTPGNPLSTYTNNVFSGAYMPGGAMGNQNISNTISAAVTPITEALGQTLTQSLPGQFTASGQNIQGKGSGAFANAGAIATQSAENAAAQVATQVANNAYNTGIQQMNTAATVAPQEVQSTVNALQAELLPTLLQEQGITNGLQAFQENVSALTGFINSISGAENPVVGNTSTSEGTQQGSMLGGLSSLFSSNNQGQSPFSNIMNGVGNAASGAMQGLSALMLL